MISNLFPSFTNNFRQFLIENKVIVTVVGLLIYSELKIFVDILMIGFIQPIIDYILEINLDVNNDDMNDLRSIFEYKINIGKRKEILIGKILKEIIRLIIIIIIILIISLITRKFLKSGISSKFLN